MTESTPYTALKLVYDRKTKTYRLEVIRDAFLHMIHHGYFVYETAKPDEALAMIQAGRCLTSWKPEALLAVIGFLGLEPVAK